MGLTHDDVERIVSEDGRDVLRLLVQSHLDLQAAEDQGRPAPIGADGQERGHRRDTSRMLKAVFGPLDVHRVTFTARDAPGGLRPLDVELTGRAAVDYSDFYDDRQGRRIKREEGVGSGKLVVLTTDGKGIVVRPDALREATREATRKKAEREEKKLTARLSPGEKRNRKRMAEVAAVYELEPRARTPADIRSLPGDQPREKGRPPRPHPENKRVWASVDKSLKEVVQECFDEALARDGWLRQRWV